MFSKVLAILSVASLAVALPQLGGAPDSIVPGVAVPILGSTPETSTSANSPSTSASSNTGTNSCANNQTMSCCAGGPGNSLLPNLSCIQVPIIAVDVPHNCGDFVDACCNNDNIQGGVALSAHCNPIKVL